MLHINVAFTLLLLVSVTAFTVKVPPNQPKTFYASTVMHGCRRNFLENTLLSSVVTLVTTTQFPNTAFADVDFSTIQDLLGTQNQESQVYTPGGPRPMYLTEPTEEFKLNEQKSMEFKRKNLELKKKFSMALDKITNDPNDASMLALDLDVVRTLVKSNGGLPEGITKDEVIKICRRRKSKKFWPTEVEIAYQDLLAEIAYQQSPNTDRDTSKL